MNKSWLIVDGHLYYYLNLEQQSLYACFFLMCVFEKHSLLFFLQMTKGKVLELLLLQEMKIIGNVRMNDSGEQIIEKTLKNAGC